MSGNFAGKPAVFVAALAAALVLAHGAASASAAGQEFPAPCALAVSKDGAALYVVEAGARRVAILAAESGKEGGVIDMPAEPTGLVLSRDNQWLYVTCAAPEGQVILVDLVWKKAAGAIPAGHGACAPALSPDGATLYVCNRFDNDVSFIDLKAAREVARVAATREPVAAALTPDGALLFVANHLPAGRADGEYAAARVDVIETAGRKPAGHIPLPNGGGGVRGVCVSPDGKYAFVTHVLARYFMPTTQIDRGWMNTNALTVIDVEALAPINTVLLDRMDRGAANPWAVACADDGKSVCVTHAGTHELSVIDAPALIARLRSVASDSSDSLKRGYGAQAAKPADVPNDLGFLLGLRRRIPLKGNGPRALALSGATAFIAGFFSDTVERVELNEKASGAPKAFSLGLGQKMDIVRKGERLFNDASLCFQGWQSCATCHPGARADALNWDLMNDGLGNPKNTKSLLLSHRTPPAMSSGIREDAAKAVRSGISFIQFATRPEEDARAMDEYLKALAPAPSPRLAPGGKLSEAARRGKKAFFDSETDCARCHDGALYTNLKTYDVGTRGTYDTRGDFDTPTLIELWRTAPYLHDGRSATIHDVLTKDNPSGRHGKTSHLTPEQVADLAEFVLSL